MAVSNVAPPKEVPPTLLNIWQSVMSENEWLFNQVTGLGTLPDNGCPVYIQPERDVLARALYNSFSLMRDRLNYDLIPTWHTERIPLGRGVPYQLQDLTTRYGYVKAFGTRTVALIDDDVTVTYSDSDGDGVDDTATISVTTSIDTDEIHVYFRTADGAPAAADARYEIFPLQFSASGGVVTITGHRALFVKPSTIWNVPYANSNTKTRNAANTNDPADFVTLVDVYRVYANSAAQVTLVADPFQRPGCNANDLDTDQTTTGVCWIEDAEMGIFSVRIPPDDSCWRYRPQYAYVHYLAGMDLQYGTMDGQLAEGLTHLANASLPYVVCQPCHAANKSFVEDLGTFLDTGTERAFINDGRMFGTRIGAQRAQQAVMERKSGRGMKMTRGKAW